ncbi:Aldo/keto reductase [Boletus coccyginus]|nr:Aldo/keto reductase [Boletus coccyginus]
MSLTIKSTVQLTSGHTMPLLGFGVYQNYNTRPSVITALAAGYRHVDSAQAYKNEAAVGEAVRESGLDRGVVFITTKCTSKTHGYESTLKGVEDSLARFGFERRLATYRAMLAAQKGGKIRTVGVSNYGIKHLEEIKNAGLQMPAVNQIELHPLCQQRPIVDYCRAHEIVIQAYCPIMRGQMRNPVIQAIAKKLGRDPAQILLRWSLQKGFVPLPKSATSSRIKSNTEIYDFSLGSEDTTLLDNLDLGSAGAISWNPVDAA